MKIVHALEVQPQQVTEAGAARATVRWLLSRPEGAPNFAMRLFELEPSGCTPLHHHSWEHEVFLLEGRVAVVTDSGPAELSAWDALLVSPGERHQFRNLGEGPARLLCIIPLAPEA